MHREERAKHHTPYLPTCTLRTHVGIFPINARTAHHNNNLEPIRIPKISIHNCITHIHTMFLRNATHLLRRSITPSTRASPSLLTSHLVRSYTRGFASAAASAVQEDTIHNSPWSTFPMAPPDPIIGLTEAYLKDNDPNKVRW